MARLTFLFCLLALLSCLGIVIAEEPPQTLAAKVDKMLSSIDEAYIEARQAVMKHIEAGGEAVKAEIAALPPIARFAALGAEMELRSPDPYREVTQGFERAIALWSSGMDRLGTTLKPEFAPAMLPTIGVPKFPNYPDYYPPPYYHPDSVVPDNVATTAFLMSTVAAGTRVTKGEPAIVQKRITEFGDIRRWISLRLLIPDPRKPAEDVSLLFKDVCAKANALEEKGFFWSASAIAFLGFQQRPEFKELFESFALRLPYAIQWAAEDDARVARDESGSLYSIPPSVPGYFTREGWFANPIGYVLEMAREFRKGKGWDSLGPTPNYAPNMPPKKLPQKRAKPPEPADPPVGGAQIPEQGLVAVLLVGVLAFQVRRRAIGRK